MKKIFKIIVLIIILLSCSRSFTFICDDCDENINEIYTTDVWNRLLDKNLLELHLRVIVENDKKDYYVNFSQNSNLYLYINGKSNNSINDTMFVDTYDEYKFKRSTYSNTHITKKFYFQTSLDTILKYKSDIKLVLKSKFDTVDKEIEYYPNF